MKTTKRRLTASFLCAMIAPAMMNASPAEEITPQHGLNNVSHDQVKLEGGFWGPRLEIHHNTTIPYYAWTNRERRAMTIWIRESNETPDVKH